MDDYTRDILRAAGPEPVFGRDADGKLSLNPREPAALRIGDEPVEIHNTGAEPIEIHTERAGYLGTLPQGGHFTGSQNSWSATGPGDADPFVEIDKRAAERELDRVRRMTADFEKHQAAGLAGNGTGSRTVSPVADPVYAAMAKAMRAQDSAQRSVSKNPALAEPYSQPLLNTREGTHGDYRKTAETAQALKGVLADAARLPRADMRESVDLICTKLARIFNGDATEPDHWRDIAGYATLVAERLEPKS